MTQQEFIQELEDILQCDQAIDAQTALRDMEEWDSLAFMVIIAFFSKHFNQTITFQDLKSCNTPADIILLSKGAIA